MSVSSLFGSDIPAVDPIPLPAPVWLLKVLLDLTLTLHFAALYPLLGGLAIVVVLSLRSRASDETNQAAGTIAGWLPILMTYVINLGIPPLLFAQVLYGRALYTSSVLIGAYWIAVIPLLIITYQLLYLVKARTSEGRAYHWHAIGAILGAWAIARIYAANMTLMLDVPAWQAAYVADQSGSTFLTGPASWARWLYTIFAGMAGGGILAAWLGRRSAVSQVGREVFHRLAVRTILLGSIGSIASGVLAWSQQPVATTELAIAQPLWMAGALLWTVAGIALVCVGGLLLQRPGVIPGSLALAGTGAAFLQTAGFVICRDLIRDSALASHGMDVWDRAVAVNGSVLGLFFGLFVFGLVAVGWLASVAYRARTLKGEAS